MEAILHVASRVELNSWAMLLRTSAFDVVFRSFKYSIKCSFRSIHSLSINIVEFPWGMIS